MPSIIPSPGSPGVAPNFWSTIAIHGPYSVEAGVTLFATSLSSMFYRADFVPDSPFINHGTLWNRSEGFITFVIQSLNFDHITNNGLIVAEATRGCDADLSQEPIRQPSGGRCDHARVHPRRRVDRR